MNNQQPSSKAVLIIEDEKPMAKALEVKLNKSGFTAKAVFSGADGVKELATGSYDLALLDILMPGTDGWAVLAKIKSQSINTPIIITSNLSQQEDIAKAKSLGAKDFLVKSNISLAEIVDKVKSLLK